MMYVEVVHIGPLHTRYSVGLVCYPFPFSQIRGQESSFTRCLYVYWWKLVPFDQLLDILNIYYLAMLRLCLHGVKIQKECFQKLSPIQPGCRQTTNDLFYPTKLSYAYKKSNVTMGTRESMTMLPSDVQIYERFYWSWKYLHSE